jgi:hypothetical protein
MFDSTNIYDNRLFILDQEILGIESLDLSYTNSAVVSNMLGRNSSFTSIGGAASQQLSISRNLIYTDPIYSYIDGRAIEAGLVYNDKSCGFSNGYLTEYMVNCAVGSIPKVSTNFVIFDEIITKGLPSQTVPPPSIYIPNQGSISLVCDYSSTNRVVGFDYAIKISKKAIYVVGDKNPYEVVTVAPTQYSASVQIDVDDAFLQNSFEFLTIRQYKTVEFSIKDKTLTNTLQAISIPNASLVSERLSSSADGGVRLTLNFIGHS